MRLHKQLRRVSEWLAATLEMWCPFPGVAGSNPVPSAEEASGIAAFSGASCVLWESPRNKLSGVRMWTLGDNEAPEIP